jgi:outer membrane protein OmpA-like peptidoglycan-associated protein
MTKQTLQTTMVVAAAALLPMALGGCVATRSWVDSRVHPIETQLAEVDAKSDRALAGLDHLHLERSMVLDMKNGATFGSGSASLTPGARAEIDRFFKQLEETNGGAEAAADRLFVVTGHTDSTGPKDYNYDLAQHRAERVAGYLVSEKGVDPMQVRVASYGEAKPIASNHSSSGRRSNRRIEILVYQEKVTTFWDKVTTALR